VGLSNISTIQKLAEARRKQREARYMRAREDARRRWADIMLQRQRFTREDLLTEFDKLREAGMTQGDAERAIHAVLAAAASTAEHVVNLHLGMHTQTNEGT
jgi:hypothetical protein